MAKKKKRPGRMFTREQRRANAAAAAMSPPTQEQIDRDTILSAGYDARILGDARWLAESWLIIEEDDYESEDAEVARAMARQFRRITGDVLTIEVAEELEDSVEQQREDAEAHLYFEE